jgi:hypothetical protein
MHATRATLTVHLLHKETICSSYRRSFTTSATLIVLIIRVVRERLGCGRGSEYGYGIIKDSASTHAGMKNERTETAL